MIMVLTCHTKGCDNFEIGIDFPDPSQLVICGPCGIEITDKVQQSTKGNK
jgi:hypothetical protein